MPQPSILRAVIGLFVGLFAGISLATSILPTVLSRLFGFDSFVALFLIREVVWPVIITWLICGFWLGCQGGMWTGGLILGLCGAVSGTFLGVFAFDGVLSHVLVSLLTGFIYGGIGGLILGRAFPAAE